MSYSLKLVRDNPPVCQRGLPKGVILDDIIKTLKSEFCKDLVESTNTELNITMEDGSTDVICFNTGYLFYYWLNIDQGYDFSPFWSVPTESEDLFFPNDDAPRYAFILKYCNPRSIEVFRSVAVARELLWNMYPECYDEIWKTFMSPDVQLFRDSHLQRRQHSRVIHPITQTDIHTQSTGEYLYHLLQPQFRFPRFNSNLKSNLSTENVVSYCRVPKRQLFKLFNISFLEVELIVTKKDVANSDLLLGLDDVSERCNVTDEYKELHSDYWVVLYGTMDRPFEGHANAFVYSIKHNKYIFFEPHGITPAKQARRNLLLKVLAKLLRQRDNEFYTRLLYGLESTTIQSDITFVNETIQKQIYEHFDGLIDLTKINIGPQQHPSDDYCLTHSTVFLLHFLSLLSSKTSDDTWGEAVKDYHVFVLYIRMTGLGLWAIHNMQLDIAALLDQVAETNLKLFSRKTFVDRQSQSVLGIGKRLQILLDTKGWFSPLLNRF
jgi:hypothetical protein